MHGRCDERFIAIKALAEKLAVEDDDGFAVDDLSCEIRHRRRYTSTSGDRPYGALVHRECTPRAPTSETVHLTKEEKFAVTHHRLSPERHRDDVDLRALPGRTPPAERSVRTTSHPGHPARAMTLGEYVHRRNGTPLGGAGSLRNMLSRSLGAKSFAAFWQHWNPIWGYGLGKFVYAPVRRYAPAAVAVLATFFVSGVAHDAAVTIVRRSFTFTVTPWFLLLGIGVLVARATHMDLSQRPWWWRAAVNLSYLVGCLAATVYFLSFLSQG